MGMDANGGLLLRYGSCFLFMNCDLNRFCVQAKTHQIYTRSQNHQPNKRSTFDSKAVLWVLAARRLVSNDAALYQLTKRGKIDFSSVNALSGWKCKACARWHAHSSNSRMLLVWWAWKPNWWCCAQYTYFYFGGQQSDVWNFWITREIGACISSLMECMKTASFQSIMIFFSFVRSFVRALNLIAKNEHWITQYSGCDTIACARSESQLIYCKAIEDEKKKKKSNNNNGHSWISAQVVLHSMLNTQTAHSDEYVSLSHVRGIVHATGIFCFG